MPESLRPPSVKARPLSAQIAIQGLLFARGVFAIGLIEGFDGLVAFVRVEQSGVARTAGAVGGDAAAAVEQAGGPEFLDARQVLDRLKAEVIKESVRGAPHHRTA